VKKELFNKILIGFAFSPNLKANVFEALRLADFFNASLFFLHVGEKTESKESAFLKILKASPLSNKITLLWKKGDPVNTILSACKENKIDLLLLGALKRENMLKFYLGSIARKLTRRSRCSVLLLIDPSIENTPAQHIVVNAFDNSEAENTILKAFSFAFASKIPKITLVEEINRSNLNLNVYDDRSLRRTTLKKEKIKRRELTRITKILKKLLSIFKENIKINTQSIFGTRGYSIGHYAKVKRADLLIMTSNEKKDSFFSKFFPKDLDYILGELPANVLILKNSKDG